MQKKSDNTMEKYVRGISVFIGKKYNIPPEKVLYIIGDWDDYKEEFLIKDKTKVN